MESPARFRIAPPEYARGIPTRRPSCRAPSGRPGSGRRNRPLPAARQAAERASVSLKNLLQRQADDAVVRSYKKLVRGSGKSRDIERRKTFRERKPPVIRSIVDEQAPI